MTLIDKIMLGLCAALVAVVIFVGAPNAESAPENVLVLSDSNTVTLNMVVAPRTVKDVQVALLEKSSKLRAGDDLYLFLNSPGGYISSGQELIEMAQNLPQKVSTITNFSASMSFVISQYLPGKRIILPSGLMMSHRAYGGVEGEMPGSITSRLNQFQDMVNRIESDVAARAKMPLDKYTALIRDELWMNAQDAVMKNFADAIKSVRCDRSLMKNVTQTFDVMMFRVEVTFSKCPLISEPVKVEITDLYDRLITTGTTKEPKNSLNSLGRYEIREAIELMFGNKPEFVRRYIMTGRYGQLFR